jgi:hypothetical protein
VNVGRLTLHTGPLTPSEARELAEQVAEALGGMPLPSGAVGTVRVDVAQPASGGVATLRDAIIRSISAALEGTTPGGGGGARP